MQDIRKAVRHLKQHQIYPASKSDLLETCDKLSDLSEGDKQWLEIHLPDCEYSSAEEVIGTLGWNQQNYSTYA